MQDWVMTVEKIIQQSKIAAFWLIEYLSSPEGRSYLKYVPSHSQ